MKLKITPVLFAIDVSIIVTGAQILVMIGYDARDCSLVGFGAFIGLVIAVASWRDLR